MPTVRLDPDELAADLVLAEGERLPSATHALVFLARNGVKHGLQHPSLAGVADLVGPTALRVAVGVHPLPGRAGWVCYRFPLGPDAALTAGELDPPPAPRWVDAGEVLARRHPAIAGEPGQTVTGRPLPVPTVDDPPFIAAAGVEATRDGLHLIARQTGVPHLGIGGEVEVRQAIRLVGDLEPDGPAIDVPGDLVIEGHVERPAGISAGGDVYVAGGVQGTPVRAGGRIVVLGGVRQGAQLVAGQDVYARFVEHASIEAGRDVLVREDLIRANVSAPRARVGGSIVGGELALLEWLVAGTLGSEFAVPTHVAVVPPPPPADDGRAIARARRELAEQELRLEILLDEHRRLAKDPRNEAARAMVVKLAKLILHLRERDKALAEQAAAQPTPAPVARPYVRVHGELHPGVVVQLGAQHLRSATRVPAALLLEGASAVEIAPPDLAIEAGQPLTLSAAGRPNG